MSAEGLLRRCESYKQGVCPMGVLFITQGVDCQIDRLEVSTWGWGKGEESYFIVGFELSDDPPNGTSVQLQQAHIKLGGSPSELPQAAFAALSAFPVLPSPLDPPPSVDRVEEVDAKLKRGRLVRRIRNVEMPEK